MYIPNDIAFFEAEGLLSADTFASYFSLEAWPGQFIKWSDFFNKFGKIPVKIRGDVLFSDEAIIAIFAHEMFELNALRKIFFDNGGKLPAEILHGLLSIGIPKNLHDRAWDLANQIIQDLRRGHK